MSLLRVSWKLGGLVGYVLSHFRTNDHWCSIWPLVAGVNAQFVGYLLSSLHPTQFPATSQLCTSRFGARRGAVHLPCPHPYMYTGPFSLQLFF
jgi:hypothetical protein